MDFSSINSVEDLLIQNKNKENIDMKEICEILNELDPVQSKNVITFLLSKLSDWHNQMASSMMESNPKESLGWVYDESKIETAIGIIDGIDVS